MPSLLRFVLHEILLVRWWARALLLVVSFSASIFGLAGPLAQKEFIDSLVQSSSHISDLLYINTRFSTQEYLWIAFFCLLLNLILSGLTNYIGAYESIKTQRRLAHKLFDKVLELRNDSMKGKATGEWVSVYATDIPHATVFLEQSLPMGASILFPLILTPLVLVLGFGFPWKLTCLVLFLLILINLGMAYRQSLFFYKFKKLAADRIGIVNEWIQNIRTLRILSWVNYFEKKIFEVREIETINRIGMVTNGQTMNAFSSSITYFMNVGALCLLAYSSETPLTPGSVLALLWIVAIFLMRTFRQLPWFFTFVFDSWTSMKRIHEFLSIQNTNRSLTAETNINTELNPQYAIEVEDLSLKLSEKLILDRVSFKVKPNQFICIVGEVGAGKTQLLQSLIRENFANFDQYSLFGQDVRSFSDTELRSHFSLAPQDSFIMSASLKENVLFKYLNSIDEALDEPVLESLRKAHFSMNQQRFPDGLLTKIGERGVNLSGGQRQRVNLARVDHNLSPIVLLDDSISAVDVRTENWLLENLFYKEWKNRTILLTTHRLKVIKQADSILFLQKGKLLDQGSFNELFERCPDFKVFVSSIVDEEPSSLNEGDSHD